MATNEKLNKDVRVKRIDRPGCFGTIAAIIEETGMVVKGQTRPQMIKVQWDNGTLSYLAPENLEAVSAS